MERGRAKWTLNLDRKQGDVAAISYHHTVKDLQGWSWASEGPFSRLEWYSLLEQAGHEPLFAVARGKYHSVCLPLGRAANGLASLTNWYAFTCHILHQGEDPDARERRFLLASLAMDLGKQTDRIEFLKLALSDAEILTEAFRASGWTVLSTVCETNRYATFDRSDASDHNVFATYLAGLPGKLRTTLKRKAKKVDVALATAFSASDWADYESIYADSWKPKEGDPDMLRKFAEQESVAGRYRLGIARHDGKAVAAQFWTVEGGTAYIHKLAHRPSAEKLSPGTTLTATLMEHVLDTDQVSEVDFGTGDDPYKRDWMKDSRSRYSLTCLRPGSPRNWPIMGKALIRKLVRRPSAG